MQPNDRAMARKTPQRQLTLSAELRNVIDEHHIFTTRTRMKVLSALDNITKDTVEERGKSLRYKAIQEILTSEVSYLHQLELIMKLFYQIWKTSAFISHTTYLTLFGHIESLYNVNGELLNELKQNPENIAATFLKLAPFFKLYSVYAYDYKEAIAVLQDSKLGFAKVNPDLNTFIGNQESRPEVGAKLMSLLIAPIQRIPRYRLLLKEVLSYTPTTHPDYTVLLASLREVEKAAGHINSLVQEHENMQRMLKLQRCLCGGKPRIITPGRRLIKEGILMKVSEKGRRSHFRYFVLFSDMLMYCKIKISPPSGPNSLKCCCILPLKKCTVDEILSKGMFKVTCHGETIILCSPSIEEGDSWISALKNAVKQYHECRQTLRKDSSSRRPMRHRFECDLSQEDILQPVKKITCSKQES
ncbi:hypothetical protein L9F63_004427, partial [Diploptera punctata]